MRLRSTPPAIPSELLDQFGEPEHAFGPNMRLHVVAAICGSVLVVMGVLFLLIGLAAGGAKFPLNDLVSVKIGVALIFLGAVFLVGIRLVPRNWVFVCPRGLIRTRGTAWDGVGWTDVERFEDATLTHKGLTARQCRIVLKGGTEWGFLADYIADYRRLTEVLRQRVALS
jgi:hypothetical protein